MGGKGFCRTNQNMAATALNYSCSKRKFSKVVMKAVVLQFIFITVPLVLDTLRGNSSATLLLHISCIICIGLPLSCLPVIVCISKHVNIIVILPGLIQLNPGATDISTFKTQNIYFCARWPTHNSTQLN